MTDRTDAPEPAAQAPGAPDVASPTDQAPPSVSWVAPSDPAPAAPVRFRSASTRATVLLILLGLNIVASLIASLIILSGKSALTDYEAGTGGIDRLDAFDSAFATFGLVEIAVFVGAAIAWLAWQSRTVDNEDALGIGHSDVSPRWSIGWWLIPIANLFMPYRALREIQRRYAGGAAIGGGLAIVWWIAWVANNIVSNVVGRLWVAADTFDTLQSALSIYLVSEGLTILAAVLAILLVRGIQARADALASSAAGGADVQRGPAAMPDAAPPDEVAMPDTAPPEPALDAHPTPDAQPTA